MTDVRDVNLNRLAIFVAVVDAGSLTAAAARLGLAKTMVSTHMQRLEAEVGTSLLVRTTRRLGVTEAGRAFYEASVKILRATEEALNAISGETAPVRGTLRVSSPIDYGALVELLCSDQYVDLIADGIDVAIRLGRLADSNYREVKLGSFVKWIVASQAFVDTWGIPRTPAELSALPFCALTVLLRPLTLELRRCDDDGGDSAIDSVRCENAFLTNTADACRAATLAGGGFGLLTDFSIGDDITAGQLIRLLPQWATGSASIQAVFPPTSHPPAKVRALIETLKRRLANPV